MTQKANNIISNAQETTTKVLTDLRAQQTVYLGKNFVVTTNPKERVSLIDLIFELRDQLTIKSTSEERKQVQWTLLTIGRIAEIQETDPEQKEFVKQAVKAVNKALQFLTEDTVIFNRAEKVQKAISRLFLAKEWLSLYYQHAYLDSEEVKYADWGSQNGVILDHSLIPQKTVMSFMGTPYRTLEGFATMIKWHLRLKSYIGASQVDKIIDTESLPASQKDSLLICTTLQNLTAVQKNELRLLAKHPNPEVSTYAKSLLLWFQTQEVVEANKKCIQEIDRLSVKITKSRVGFNKDFLKEHFPSFADVLTYQMDYTSTVQKEQAEADLRGETLENALDPQEVEKRLKLCKMAADQIKIIHLVYEIWYKEINSLKNALNKHQRTDFLSKYSKNVCPSVTWHSNNLPSPEEFSAFDPLKSQRLEIDPTLFEPSGSMKDYLASLASEIKIEPLEEKSELSEEGSSSVILSETPFPQPSASSRSFSIKELLNNREFPFEETFYADRVLIWEENPEMALQQVEYQKLSLKIQKKIIWIHSFSRNVDLFAGTGYSYCQKRRNNTTGEYDVVYCIPAEVKDLSGNTYRGVFQLAYDVHGECYHRCFAEKKIDQMLNNQIWEDINYPPLQDTSKIDAAKKRPHREMVGDVPMKQDPYFEIISFEDPTNGLTINLLKVADKVLHV